MSDGVRFQFINYSQTDAKVTVATSDRIVYMELLPDTSVEAPGGNLTLVEPGKHALRVPAGTLWGFASAGVAPTISIAGALTVVVAAGKDPWPQPPPKPQKLATVTDWDTRYENSLAPAGVGPANGRKHKRTTHHDARRP